MNRYDYLARLREPSTWAGFAAIGMLFGQSPETVNGWVQAGIAIAGTAAILMGEKGQGGKKSKASPPQE